MADKASLTPGAVSYLVGTGDPLADADAQAAAVGSLYVRRDGPVGAALYQKYTAGTTGEWRRNDERDVRNVKSFGAKGDGATDDQPAIQAVIDAAMAATPHGGGLKTVYLPPGDYTLGKPLVVRAPASSTTSERVRIAGAGRYDTLLRGANPWYGPLILTTPPADLWPDVPIAGALATGSGGSLRLYAPSSGPTVTLNLGDAHVTSLNGLGQLSVEFFLKLTGLPVNRFVVLTSRGQRFASEPAAQALRICYNNVPGNERMEAWLNVGGTLRVLGMGARSLIGDGATHHFALDYDGSSVRTFVDGQLVDSVSASGTVVQALHEDFQIGCESGQWPEHSSTDAGPDGWLDSMRISRASRRTAAFAPPSAKYAWDSSTIFLLNFDDNQGPFTVARVGSNEKFYMALRRGEYSGLQSQIDFAEFSMNGQDRNLWMINFGLIESSFERLHLIFAGSVGWLRYNNCFLDTTRDCDMLSGNYTRVVMCQTNLSGAGLMANNRITGGYYQHVMTVSGDTGVNNFYLPGPGSILSVFVRSNGESGNITLLHPIVDQESLGANWEGAIAFCTLGKVTLVGGEIEGQSKPAVILDSVGSFSAFGTRVNSASAPEVIKSLSPSPLRAPYTLYSPVQRGTSPTPWTLATDGSVAVHEFGAFTRADRSLGTVGAGGATIDWREGTTQKVTLGAATVPVAFSNGLQGPALNLELAQDATGGRAVTWPSSVKWPGGTPPSLSSAAGKTDIVRFIFNGSSYFGAIVGTGY